MGKFITDRFKGLQDGQIYFSFIPGEMCKHLVKCLEQNCMEPFPKRKLKSVNKIDTIKVKILLLCCCSLPEVKCLGPWTVCDDHNKWY